jgi:DNA-binding XRE family transcriptional regulator
MSKIKRIEIAGKRFAAVPEDLFRRMREALEDLDDVRLFDEAVSKSRPQDRLSEKEARRMLKGESLVRIWREHRKLTQSALAKAADISKPYLSEIETVRKEPSLAVLKRLAAALDVRLDDLV